jgi:hyperosmotically inducible periplasmic protein
MAGQSIRWITIAAFTTLGVACAQTDAGITTAVKTKLVADTEVSASQINVDTDHKVVTLKGDVDTQAAKTRAIQIARETSGVVQVVDNLTVKETTAAGPTTATFADPMLTATVKSKLQADPTIGRLAIFVDTDNAIVTLTGKVKSQAEKDTAVRLAKETEGVKDVIDQMTIAVK